jgi:Txe/YoeB family toxin of Txe-Axe toxin-antitoxin module
VTSSSSSQIKSLVRPSFWRAYAALDSRVRSEARRAYQLFVQNPHHPSLRFKKLQGYENAWSVRINEQYRAVGERKADTIERAWIGSHNEFDNRFG